jgi:hypothetical protein
MTRPSSLFCIRTTALLMLIGIGSWTALSSGGCDPCATCVPIVTRTPTPTAMPVTPTPTPAPTHTPSPTATSSASPTPAAGACQPAGSLSVMAQGTNVVSYVPNGAWQQAATGVKLVQIEGTGVGSANIATPNAVNSCSSNSSTGVTVCTANGSDVYIIRGSSLSSTLTDSVTGSFGAFSGGACTTCGVTIDPTTNLAVIGLSLTGAPSSASGYQLLNLTNNTFQTPIPTENVNIAESFASDPTRHLVLSPGYPSTSTANYEILDLTNPSAPAIFNLMNASTLFSGATLDGGAADCSTGIIVASDEFSSNVFIADLTQATFTPGTGGNPGTWNAPNQLQNLPQFSSFGAGTTGISVASGSHLGILEDEFGTTAFGAIQLPATSGSGTHAIQDWVVANMPNDPNNTGWLMTLDPHGLTSYVSPTSGKAFGLIMNNQRTFIAVVDIKALLAATRSPVHTVSSSVDLVGTGVVRFVALP